MFACCAGIPYDLPVCLLMQIVGLRAHEAITQLAYSARKRGKVLRLAVERAVQNADQYHELAANELTVEKVWTGKHLTSPRVRHHSKGRAGRSHYRTSMVTVQLREAGEGAPGRAPKFKLPTAASRARLNPRAY